MREAGVEVITGVLTAEADAMQAGFLHRVRHGRPLVTLKLASTLDGRIATRGGESQWITGPAAREAAHACAAVMTRCWSASAPSPPTIPPHLPHSRASAPGRWCASWWTAISAPALTARLVATAADPTWIVHRGGVPADRRHAFTGAGVRLFDVAGGERGVDLRAGLLALGDRRVDPGAGGGRAQLAAGLLRDGLVDRIAWFHAPAVMGGDGWPAAQAFGVAGLDAMPRFTRTGGTRPVGDDMLTEFSLGA